MRPTCSRCGSPNRPTAWSSSTTRGCGSSATIPRAGQASLSVDGLSYDALEPQLPARRRLEWLARDPDGHTPLPYEQLAAHYTAIGQPGEARRVMYASERILRRAKAPLSRAWGLLQDVTIGYGYRPWRAVAWLVLLLAAGSVTFAVHPPPPLQPSQRRTSTR